MRTVHTVTNWHARNVVTEWDTTAAERAELDYIDWDACMRGEDSFSGVRYRGSLYDLGEFEHATTGTLASDWDGWQTQSSFDAIAIRYVEDFERVIVAHLHW